MNERAGREHMAEAKAGAEGQDPSMEEILQSIRRIIAEEDQKEPAENSAAAPAGNGGLGVEVTPMAAGPGRGGIEVSAMAAGPGMGSIEVTPMAAGPGMGSIEVTPMGKNELSSDVLELTEMLQEDGSVLSLDGGAAQDVLASIDSALAPEQPLPDYIPPASVAKAAPPDTIPTPPPVENAPMPDDSQLLSEQAASASAAALKKLNQPRPAAPARTPSMEFRAGGTVEDLVIELLRPMMKEWLDGNLPGIVERLVEREVKKLREE